MLFNEIAALLQSAPFTSAVDGVAPLFGYNTFPGCLLNLMHAFLHHSNSSVLAKLPRYNVCLGMSHAWFVFQDKLPPLKKTTKQRYRCSIARIECTARVLFKTVVVLLEAEVITSARIG